MASKDKPKGRENDIVLQQLKDEVLIYDLTINKAFSLNETSALIWNLCDGNNSVADISGQLSKKLNQPVTDDLVWLALDQFKKDNLLANNEQVEIKFDGLTRREVIRKVGFASMIALPVISSIIAPTAANAASGGGTATLGQSCAASVDCASSAPVCANLILVGGKACCNATAGGTSRYVSGQLYGTSVSGDCTTASCSNTQVLCCSGSATRTSCSAIGTTGNSSIQCKCS